MRNCGSGRSKLRFFDLGIKPKPIPGANPTVNGQRNRTRKDRHRYRQEPDNGAYVTISAEIGTVYYGGLGLIRKVPQDLPEAAQFCSSTPNTMTDKVCGTASKVKAPPSTLKKHSHPLDPLDADEVCIDHLGNESDNH